MARACLAVRRDSPPAARSRSATPGPCDRASGCGRCSCWSRSARRPSRATAPASPGWSAACSDRGPSAGSRLGVCVAGIEHRRVVGAQFERAVDRSVRVDPRVAPVGRDHVVQVGLRIGPVPLRDDDVALDALRPLRRRRQLAGLDRDRSSRRTSSARAPAEVVERAFICPPACPDFTRRSHAGNASRERTERGRDLAGALGAERVARGAAARLHAGGSSRPGSSCSG